MGPFHLKVCLKCRGDLVLDEGDWLCLQCGKYYYTSLYRDYVGPGDDVGTRDEVGPRDADRWDRPYLAAHRTKRASTQRTLIQCSRIITTSVIGPASPLLTNGPVDSQRMRVLEAGRIHQTEVRQP